mmetsp:Transcript_18698/g.56548  ORF Transcript_18698/g.56548 Transcript_18698/m.56548 type:complete len:448 (+) Transcript_18698:187-1530(+)
MRAACWLNVLLLASVVLVGQHAVVSATELEGFDDLDDEPILQPPIATDASPEELAERIAAVSDPVAAAAGETPAVGVDGAAAAAAAVESEKTATGGAQKSKASYSAFRKVSSWRDVQRELIFAAIIWLYALNVYLGRQANSRIALAWANAFCQEGRVLDRNFSQLGIENDPNAPVMERVSNSEFKLYATGRRFCSHLNATLSLRKRQDLLSMAMYQVNPRPDALDVEVAMSEGAMPPMVLFVGLSKFAKEWLSEEGSDLAAFTHTIDVARDRLHRWPSDRLVVLAEHSSLLYDVMTEPMMEQVFSQQAFESVRKYFRYLLFTTEDSASKLPRTLRFSFALPHVTKMEDLDTLMAAVCAFIDIVGCYAAQFTPDQRKRAAAKRAEVEAVRLKSAATSEEAVDRAWALRQKKEQEKLEMLKKMTPQQKQKFEEKQRAKMMRKAFKTKKG